jgi:hypothetical protein
VQRHGPARARFVLDELARQARQQRIGWQPELNTPYANTVAVEQQAPFPGDLAVEEKLASIMRWNALAMVVRANQTYGDLGGHIASYASAADLFEVGFNHFFRARNAQSASSATWCSSSRTVRPGSTRAPSSKAGWTKPTCCTTGRRSPPPPRRAGPVELPAPLADARLLAVPHRVDGHRADQLDLPCALHALPDAPPAAAPPATLRRSGRSGACGACSATAKWTSPSR